MLVFMVCMLSSPRFQDYVDGLWARHETDYWALGSTWHVLGSLLRDLSTLSKLGWTRVIALSVCSPCTQEEDLNGISSRACDL